MNLINWHRRWGRCHSSRQQERHRDHHPGVDPGWPGDGAGLGRWKMGQNMGLNMINDFKCIVYMYMICICRCRCICIYIYIYYVSLWGYTYVVICLKHLGDMSWDFLIVEMGNPFLNSKKGWQRVLTTAQMSGNLLQWAVEDPWFPSWKRSTFMVAVFHICYVLV